MNNGRLNLEVQEFQELLLLVLSAAVSPVFNLVPVDPFTYTSSCTGGSSLSCGTWFVPNLPVINVSTFSTIPFIIGEPQAPRAPLGIANVAGSFTLTNAGVYYVAYAVCTAEGHQPFQLTLNRSPIVGGKMRAGLDRVIKPIMLTFAAPANAVIRLVNISP